MTPHTRRRFLTAAGAAATGAVAATIASPHPAIADPSCPADIVLCPSGDTTGATDTAALLAAITSLGGPGIIEATRGVFYFNAAITIPDAVNLVGTGNNLDDTSTPGTWFKLVTSSASLIFAGSGGVSGQFLVDGTDVATTPLRRVLGAHRTFMAVDVFRSAQDNWVIEKAQNDLYLGCNTQDAARDALVLDQGTGGLEFERLEVNSAGRYLVRIDQTATGPYPDEPTHIAFRHSIFENNVAQNVAVQTAIKAHRGVYIGFHDCVFAPHLDLEGDQYVITIDDFAELSFSDCRFFGLDPEGSVTGLHLSQYAQATLQGRCEFFACGNGALDFPAGAQVNVLGTMKLYSSPLASTGTPEDLYAGAYTLNPRYVTRRTNGQLVQQAGIEGETGFRFRDYVDGSRGYVHGGDTYVAEAMFGTTQKYSLANLTGSLDGAMSSIDHASAGTITVDAARGNCAQVLLSANCTGTTIVNPKPGMVLRIAYAQLGAGAPYSWVPPIAKYAGSPPTPGATTRYAYDIISLFYDGTSWCEIARSLDVK